MLYGAMFKSKGIEIEADNAYQAQQKAAEIFKARRPWEIIIMRIVDDKGNDIIHDGAEL